MPASKKKQQVPDTIIKVSRQGTTYQQKTYRVTERSHGVTQDPAEEYEEVIVDRSAAEILDQINKRVRSPYYSLYCGIAALVSLFIFVPLAFLLAVATCFLYIEDIKRKTTPLFYEFSDDYSEKKFQDGIACFSQLAVTKGAWRLKSKIAINDWKRNAGSNSALIRQRSKIGHHQPNLLKTNVEVWGVDAGSIKLYLLPDRFFVFQDGVYSTTSYSEIHTTFQDLEYVEQESLPGDATVIGKTWKYVRRDGGADRRFNNNRQLPIVRYGVIAFSSPNFTAYLIISSLGVASSFTRSFSNLLTSSSTSTKPLRPSNNQIKPTLPETDTSLESLAPLRKAASQKLELTTSQLAQIIGVSTAFITKNPVSFDYEGFRFTRSGRSGRQISWRIEYIGKAR